jgi:hypothetical protein
MAGNEERCIPAKWHQNTVEQYRWRTDHGQGYRLLAVDDKHIRDTNPPTSDHTISVQSGYLFSSIHLSSMWLTFLIRKWSFEPPTIEL